MVAVPLEEVIGGSMDRFFGELDRLHYEALLAQGSGKRRTRLIGANGRTTDVLISLTTTMCEDVERRNLIVTDLSELLDAQSGRDRAEQQSQAKDEFMAMLAHELRNPLSAITAAMQVLDDSRAQVGAASRARFIIGRQVRHLSRLVDDLLDVGRAVTGKIALERRRVDLSDLVRRTVAAFTERETRHVFEFDARPEPAWIDGDAVRIDQVVTNIMGNAVKYTPAGGEIAVSVGLEGGEAVLRVRDDGSGIAPELLPRIFDLFVQGERTLDRAQGGLGIGLTLVRRLVNLHQGTVSATSDGPGQGSEFTVRIPAACVRGVEPDRDALVARSGPSDATAEVNLPADAASESASVRVAASGARPDTRSDGRPEETSDARSDAQPDARPPSRHDAAGERAAKGSRRVLIVEDNRDSREMFRMMLELEGHHVVEAEEGLSGLQLLTREDLDVAFIDVGLPGLDGYEIVRRYRAEAARRLYSPETETVLLVALTGYGTPDAVERSRRAGFDFHLIKPVNPATLYKLLTREPSARTRNLPSESDNDSLTSDTTTVSAAHTSNAGAFSDRESTEDGSIPAVSRFGRPPSGQLAPPADRPAVTLDRP
jgi:signal transduction histidine kinase/DNA-binding NarL/FixJ family response regulator